MRIFPNVNQQIGCLLCFYLTSMLGWPLMQTSRPTSAALALLHCMGVLHGLLSVCPGNAQGERTQRENYTACTTQSLPNALAPCVASHTVSRNAHECL